MSKSKLYTKTFTLPDGTRKYVRAKSKAALEEKVASLKAQIQAGIDIGDNTTFGEFAQLWYDTYKKPHLTENSLVDLRHILNDLVLPTLAGLPLKSIKPMHIQHLMASITDYSHRTQSKVLSYTRAIFNAAVDNGLVARSPVPLTLKAGGKPAEPRKPLTEEQTARLLKATEGLRVYLPVVLMLGLGLRREEALALMWSDIDFENHIAHISRVNVFNRDGTSTISSSMKTENARRDVPVPVWVEEALMSAVGSRTSLYVCPCKDGSPMTPGSFKSAWGAIEARTAKTPEELNTACPKHPQVVRTLDFHVHAHLLRHTCATRWIEQGLNIKELQYLLGHSTPDLSMSIYAHYDHETQFKATTDKIRGVG